MALLDVAFRELLYAVVERIDPTLHRVFQGRHGRFGTVQTLIDMFLVVSDAFQKLLERYVGIHLAHAASIRHA
jgi:hypothetical protein